ILEADAILLPEKAGERAALAAVRRRLLAEVRPDAPVIPFDMPDREGNRPYLEAVARWHDATARAWAAAIPPGARRVALLVWGDPSLYDSTLRIAARLSPRPAVRVIPGITALQALTAAHAIPLNTLGGAVTITTGRRLRAEGWPHGAETLAVMLDAGGAFEVLDPERYEIWWGAYLGLPAEILEAGPLAGAAVRIRAARAAARAREGWIMDTYLLRQVAG
ncbi:MAG: precorrin-6A synthase (deacetylating), partial [Pseudomonadota bacterium]